MESRAQSCGVAEYQHSGVEAVRPLAKLIGLHDLNIQPYRRGHNEASHRLLLLPSIIGACFYLQKSQSIGLIAASCLSSFVPSRVIDLLVLLSASLRLLLRHVFAILIATTRAVFSTRSVTGGYNLFLVSSSFTSSPSSCSCRTWLGSWHPPRPLP
jgi:hypothetical protein